MLYYERKVSRTTVRSSTAVVESLIFPRHENDVTQSKRAFGRPLARYWIHNGLLNVNQEKMSKSLGNFFTIREILERADALALRRYLTSHNRFSARRAGRSGQGVGSHRRDRRAHGAQASRK
jgi:hypothetical protein